MNKILILALSFTLTHPLFASENRAIIDSERALTRMQMIKDEDLVYDDWQQIAPHLLPNNHPAKKNLDTIFTASRVTKDLQSLEAAGFETKGVRAFSRTIVAKHPKLSGYRIKLFTDDQEGIDEARKLCNRIRGSIVAKEIIARHHFEHLFKVPRKWIYVIPESKEAPGPYPKHLALIVEDMNITKKNINYARWRSDKMTKELLTAIYILLTEGGFYDAVYAFNIPFSKDGRIAVIDTEEYLGWPIAYDKIDHYLSPDMIPYWFQLTGR